MDAAIFAVDDLLDKDVFDVNGHRIGHVTLCRDAVGHVASFDVAIDRKAKRDFDAQDVDALTLRPEAVVAADFDVTLAEDGRHLFHPERYPPALVDER